ncbi:sugar ABC transporter ATP-binding protein [uncultured Modestobacter sp.]|uniref:sugar ABC transporter ATP-binding protein n=1 Tax=uncultured Modestobacter sp. TaxID=380048 RepID=UPI00262948F7|nr:sugar ABC transporter ATP-binding protein [uncultured Modestobacter sp.]
MTQDRPPLLELTGVTKRYGATTALDGVDFDLRPGEVHALMGENGAGKSTLMKILSGNVARDAGRIAIDGDPVEISGPRDAAAHGIAIIHQELNTVPAMTVADNLALGREPRTRWGSLDRRAAVREAREKLEHIGADIDPSRELGSLSVGMQQMVEIARAVSENARVLVLDEPTAALSRGESLQLYRLVEEMRSRGVGLVYISHRMEEVWQLADRITVFRDGRLVGTRERADVVPDDIVRMMVGRDVGDLYGHPPRHPGEVLLSVDGLTDGELIGPVSFTVRAGEVVGMSGLIGAGRTETCRLIFGADSARGGTVQVRGRTIRARSPQAAVAAGIAMVPEDRKAQALFLIHSVEDNISVSSLRELSRWSVVRRGAVRAGAREQMRKLGIRESALQLPVAALSGGNQQKAVLGRWLMRDADVVILDEPTRGVDVGARREIYELVEQLAAAGKAVLVVSSDLPEVIGVSDRVLVMREGRIVAELDSTTTTEEAVMSHATGTASSPSGAQHV